MRILMRRPMHWWRNPPYRSPRHRYMWYDMRTGRHRRVLYKDIRQAPVMPDYGYATTIDRLEHDGWRIYDKRFVYPEGI